MPNVTIRIAYGRSLSSLLHTIVAVPARKAMRTALADALAASRVRSTAVMGHDFLGIKFLCARPNRQPMIDGIQIFFHAAVAVLPVSREDNTVTFAEKCLALFQDRIVRNLGSLQVSHGIQRIDEQDMRVFSHKLRRNRRCGFAVVSFTPGVGMGNINHIHADLLLSHLQCLSAALAVGSL